MVWFVGFTVCFFLLLPEGCWLATREPADAWIPILALAAFPPLLAALQRMRLQGEVSAAKDASVDSSSALLKRRRLARGVALVVWLVCCAAAFLVFGWSAIVREAWGLGRLPLVDEFVLATPWLTAACFIQFLLSGHPVARSVTNFGNGEKATPPRTELRVFIGLVVVPVTVLFLVRDLVSFGIPESLKVIVIPAAAIATLLAVVALYPLIVSLTWRTRRLRDHELERDLRNMAKRHGIGLAGIRCWETGGLLVNAVVVGLIPGTRTILLTDALLRQFDKTEIECIFRHELGHLSARHLWWRLLALLSPIAFIAVGGWVWQWRVSGSNAVAASAFVAASIAMMLGLACLWRVWIGPMCRSCELAADRFAVSDANGEICREWVDAYRSALMKFAIANPASYTRPSLFHPSLRERIRCLAELVPKSEPGGQPGSEALTEPVFLPFPTA